MPVIKHADEKSIKGIAREINELALKARNKQLSQEDMSFGSVSSMGTAAIIESIVKNQSLLMI